MIFGKSILLVATLAATILVGDSASPSTNINSNILSAMNRANGVMRQNPSLSMKCFAHYIPVLDKLASGYEKKYLACENSSKDEATEVEEACMPSRISLANHSEDSCKMLSKCRHVESTEKVFECYMTGAAINTNSMKDLNTDATENMYGFKEQMRLVDVRKDKCNKEAKREYEKDNDQALDDLNRCIVGVIGVPTTTTEAVEAKLEVHALPEAPENLKNFENPLGTETLSKELSKQYLDSLRSS